MPWKVVLELNRVMAEGGLLFTATHHTWPPHELPWTTRATPRCVRGTVQSAYRLRDRARRGGFAEPDRSTGAERGEGRARLALPAGVNCARAEDRRAPGRPRLEPRRKRHRDQRLPNRDDPRTGSFARDRTRMNTWPLSRHDVVATLDPSNSRSSRASGFASPRAGEPRSLRRGSCPCPRSRSRSPSSSPGRRPRALAPAGGRGRTSASAASSGASCPPRRRSCSRRSRSPACCSAAAAPAPLPLPPVTLGPMPLPRLAPLDAGRAVARRQLVRHARDRVARLDLARPAVPRAPDRRRAAPGPEPALGDLGSCARPGARSRLPALRQRQARPSAAPGHPGLPRGQPRRAAARDRRHQPLRRRPARRARLAPERARRRRLLPAHRPARGGAHVGRPGRHPALARPAAAASWPRMPSSCSSARTSRCTAPQASSSRSTAHDNHMHVRIFP